MARIPWLGVLCMALAGCGVLDSFFLPSEDGGSSTADGVGGIVNKVPGGIGAVLGVVLGAARWGYVEFRHRQLIAAGKKDDNRDGVEDKA